LFDQISESKEYLRTFLEASRIRCFEKAYVIGSYDIKKTVATQQLRAAVLSLALNEKYDNDYIASIAVIGCGFAGITATATLLKLGHKVTAFEQKCTLLSKQKHCHDRYIHPDLYDWPLIKCSELFNVAGLSWKADYAEIVCKNVIDNFDSITCKYRDSFALRISTKIKGIKEVNRDGGKKQYNLYDTSKFCFDGFDAVLFCIGFGDEVKVPYGSRVNGYWENTALRQMRGTKMKPKRFLVSGNGDGGLVSVLDCALLDYELPKLPQMFSSVFTDEVINGLREIEYEIGEKSGNKTEIEIIKFYDDRFRELKSTWRKNIEHLMSSETKVIFNSNHSGIFSVNSSPLIRFIVYVLIRSGLIDLRNESVNSSMIKETNRNGELKYIIEWSDDEEEFDYIIIRHGVNTNYFETSFSELKEHMKGQKDYFSDLKFERAIPDEVLIFLKTM
jgi:hypothetical protein